MIFRIFNVKPLDDRWDAILIILNCRCICSAYINHQEKMLFSKMLYSFGHRIACPWILWLIPFGSRLSFSNRNFSYFCLTRPNRGDQDGSVQDLQRQGYEIIEIVRNDSTISNLVDPTSVVNNDLYDLIENHTDSSLLLTARPQQSGQHLD